MAPASTVLPQRLHPYFLQIKRRSDQLMNYFLMSYLAFGFFLASYYDTWFIAVGVGGLSLLAYFASKWLLPQSSLYQYVGSAILAIFMAQFIYQMHGMFEMHFFAYVGCTFLITYQNWRLQLPLILLIVLHHGGFAYLQYSGLKDIYFTQLDYMDLQTFIMHAALAAVIVFFCGLWAYDSERKTLQMVNDALLMENQLKNVADNVAFADQISQNNLQVAYECAKGDELGQALLNMRNSLLKSTQREAQERFGITGMARVSDILRASQDEMEKLCSQVLSYVVQYLKANQGGIFLKYGEQEDDVHLSLVASYAFERQKFLQKRIEIGEGLVGQAFLEKDTINLTDIPDAYVHITSGLGSANPTNILVVPLQSNQVVVGIIELASFNSFQAYEIAFLEKIAENIASSIVATKTNQKTQQLLADARQMTETMQVQEEKMRQNMEKLETTQAEMKRKEAHYQQWITELERKVSA